MKKVIIIGASFAGLSAYIQLKKTKLFSITLLDKKDSFEYIPSFHLLHDDLKKYTFPLKKFYPEFKQEEVIKVDKTVKTKKNKYKYDYCIIATGAKENYFGNDSFRKNTMPLKSFAHATTIQGKLKKAKSIVIIGGGITGIEVASVLAQKTDKNITLIHAMEKLMERSPEQVHKKSLSYLQKQGVTVSLADKAIAATKGEIILESGTSIHSDLMLWTAGISQKTDLIPDTTMNDDFSLVQNKDIFLCGDVARTALLPTAHNAMVAGKLVAKQIISREKTGKNASVKLPTNTNLALALGTKDGILIFKNKIISLPFIGFIKWLVWKRVELEFKTKIPLPL